MIKILIVALLFCANVFAQSKIGSGVVKNYQQDMVIKVFEVDGTSPAGIGINIGANEASYAYNGVGDTTLTFSKVFERKPIVNVIPLACNAAPKIAAVSSSAVQVQFVDLDGTPSAVDCDYHLQVIGFESANEY